MPHLAERSPMVVAFDIDDTITCHPPFFTFLANALLSAGHRVLIITFRQDRPGAEADLAAWGVAYSELITATTEQLLAHDIHAWKAHVRRSHGVHVFFEDSPDVCRHVDESTLCLMPLTCHREKLDALADALRDA